MVAASDMIANSITRTTLFAANLASPTLRKKPRFWMMVGGRTLYATDLVAILGDIRFLVGAAAHEGMNE